MSEYKLPKEVVEYWKKRLLIEMQEEQDRRVPLVAKKVIMGDENMVKQVRCVSKRTEVEMEAFLNKILNIDKEEILTIYHVGIPSEDMVVAWLITKEDWKL